MTPIMLDAEAVRKLSGLAEPVELCDPSGKVFGRFVPLIDLSGWVPISPDISDEERTRREQSREEGLTTAEAINYLVLGE